MDLDHIAKQRCETFASLEDFNENIVNPLNAKHNSKDLFFFTPTNRFIYLKCKKCAFNCQFKHQGSKKRPVNITYSMYKHKNHSTHDRHLH